MPDLTLYQVVFRHDDLFAVDDRIRYVPLLPVIPARM
jgi:hypothetical protein